MKLRKLRAKDALLMLEWMHDEIVVHYLREDFAEKTINDCIRFIDEAQDEADSIHLAIVNDQDEYMGTVSLKHIRQNTAEFGIALRTCAMGGICASFGMKEILVFGYKSRGIDDVYWCVVPENQRAIHFYEKHYYQRCDIPDQAFGYTEEEKKKYIWYRVWVPGQL